MSLSLPNWRQSFQQLASRKVLCGVGCMMSLYSYVIRETNNEFEHNPASRASETFGERPAGCGGEFARCTPTATAPVRQCRMSLPQRRAARPVYLLGSPHGNAHTSGLHPRGARTRGGALREDVGTHLRDARENFNHQSRADCSGGAELSVDERSQEGPGGAHRKHARRYDPCGRKNL